VENLKGIKVGAHAFFAVLSFFGAQRVRNIQRMETVFMKNKLFFLCLLVASSFPFTAHSQYSDWDEENSYSVEDSLRNLSKEYYSDLQHWDIYIEPGTIVGEDTVFDMAGLRHAYYVQRYYIHAIPKGANFRFMPSPLSRLFFYGQKLPVEGKELPYFQKVREAVFPYAAQFSATTPSRTIFEQYAQQRLEADLRYVIDSLMTNIVGELDLYNFNDTTPGSGYLFYRQFNSTLTCLEREIYDAIPAQTTSLSVAQLATHAIKQAPNIYLVPQNSLVKLIAHKPESYFLEGLLDCFWEFPPEISGQTYIFLDNNTIVPFNINYSWDAIGEGQMVWEYGDSESIDSVIFLSSNGYEKKRLADLYQASLKDTLHCKCLPQYPPLLEVWINDELYDKVGSHYYDINEEDKDIILQYLKEGSFLYNYFVKDLYKAENRYFDSYEPQVTYHRLSEIEESLLPTTLYLSKQQSQKIQKLLKKKNQLEYQRDIVSAKDARAHSNARIPQGQLRAKSSNSYSGGRNWILYGENRDNMGKGERTDGAITVETGTIQFLLVDNSNGICTGKYKSKYDKLTAKIKEIKEAINTVAGCKLFKNNYAGFGPEIGYEINY
jgi:hypothetical protein